MRWQKALGPRIESRGLPGAVAVTGKLSDRREYGMRWLMSLDSSISWPNAYLAFCIPKKNRAGGEDEEIFYRCQEWIQITASIIQCQLYLYKKREPFFDLKSAISFISAYDFQNSKLDWIKWWRGDVLLSWSYHSSWNYQFNFMDFCSWNHIITFQNFRGGRWILNLKMTAPRRSLFNEYFFPFVI